jgi:hypothetical protein
MDPPLWFLIAGAARSQACRESKPQIILDDSMHACPDARGPFSPAPIYNPAGNAAPRLLFPSSKRTMLE